MERTKKRLETEIDELNSKFDGESKGKAHWEKTKRKLEREVKETKQKLEEEEAAKAEFETNVWKLQEELDLVKDVSICCLRIYLSIRLPLSPSPR